MTEVVVASPTGFCFGVERAIRLAKAGKERYGRVQTLGALVHNPLVLRELEMSGIRSVQSPYRARAGALVIRAHGCSPETIERGRRLGLDIVDATCPYVRKVQSVARRMAEKGYLVVLVGERNHPEVRGILAHCAGRGRVYGAQGRFRDAGRAGKVAVVAQTTMDRDSFHQAVAKLAGLRYTELRIFDTICEEVVARQRAVARIARKVNAVIVVGGRSSANTSRLVEIARTACPRVLHVEQAAELPRSLIQGCKRVGVVAGSSTPSWVVRDIVRIARGPSRAALAPNRGRARASRGSKCPVTRRIVSNAE